MTEDHRPPPSPRTGLARTVGDVARLAAEGRLITHGHGSDVVAAELSRVEEQLLRLGASSAAYVSRDAHLTLAHLAWRTGRREEAAGRCRELADIMPAEPLRRFCLRRARH